MLTVDQIATLIGYGVMAGAGTLATGALLCLGLRRLFWHGGKEAYAFLRYLMWISRGRQRSPENAREDENERLRQVLQAIANTKTSPCDEKAAPRLASIINLAGLALAQEQGGSDASQR